MSDDRRFPADGEEFGLSYWLDVGDVIVEVSPDWENFAQENGGDGIEAKKVLGRNLLSFVHGDVTRMYVRSLVQSARMLRRPICRTYRCDSPDMRRFMEMRLTLESSGLLRWEHRTLRTEPLSRRIEFAVGSAGRSRRIVVRCSICNRLKAPGGWCEPDCYEAPLPAVEATVPVIYGVCPDCLGGRSTISASG